MSATIAIHPEVIMFANRTTGQFRKSVSIRAGILVLPLLAIILVGGWGAPSLYGQGGVRDRNRHGD